METAGWEMQQWLEENRRALESSGTLRWLENEHRQWLDNHPKPPKANERANQLWLAQYDAHMKEKPMDTSKVYPEGAGGDFLKAKDLKLDNGTFASLTLTISDAKVSAVGEGDEKHDQVVLSFQGKEKVLGLNKTNWQTLSSMYGFESDEWVGKSVRIFVDPNVEYPRGTKVGGIRIQYEATATDDSDIPF